MKVNKKIIKDKTPLRADYEREIKICPNCGYPGDNGNPPKELPSPYPIYWDWTNVIYQCKQCKTKWKVMRYEAKYPKPRRY